MRHGHWSPQSCLPEACLEVPLSKGQPPATVTTMGWWVVRAVRPWNHSCLSPSTPSVKDRWFENLKRLFGNAWEAHSRQLLICSPGAAVNIFSPVALVWSCHWGTLPSPGAKVLSNFKWNSNCCVVWDYACPLYKIKSVREVVETLFRLTSNGHSRIVKIAPPYFSFFFLSGLLLGCFSSKCWMNERNAGIA